MAITELLPDDGPKPTGKPEPPPKKPVNKILIGIIVVVIILIAAGTYWFLQVTSNTETESAEATNLNTVNTENAGNTNSQAEINANVSRVAGYEVFTNADYSFSTVNKSSWIVKEYAEQDLDNEDISKIIAFYPYDDYEKVRTGKSVDYQGSVFIEIHKPIWSEYQEVANSTSQDIQSIIVDDVSGFKDTANNIVYLTNNIYVYSLELRGSGNTKIFDEMVNNFRIH